MTDIELDIATAHSRMAKQWKNKKVKWSDLVKRCKEPTITNETAADLSGVMDDDPLVDLTTKVKNAGKNPVIVKRNSAGNGGKR